MAAQHRKSNRRLDGLKHTIQEAMSVYRQLQDLKTVTRRVLDDTGTVHYISKTG